MAVELRRTPLHAWHVAHGARMVPFGGWDMPVQYPTGILAEHRAVRAGVGLFDISHMGRVQVGGPDALALLQGTTTNDVATLAVGRAQYALVCNERGGTLDDVVVYRLEAERAGHARYLVVVNAGNRERMLSWWQAQAEANGWRVELRDRTAELSMIAVQGPAAVALLQPHTAVGLDSIRYYSIVPGNVLGHAALLARTGYTGEDGFELLPAAGEAVALWEALLAHGAETAPVPCGLGARDTLRLEAGFPLYGHELRDDVTPLEAGLGRFVKLNKGSFVGAQALRAQQAVGPPRRLVGFEMVGQGIPRQGYAVLAAGTVVGEVTSGTFGPSVNKAIGMAYVPPEWAAVGSELAIDVRGRPAAARVCALPFWPHRVRRGQATTAS